MDNNADPTVDTDASATQPQVQADPSTQIAEGPQPYFPPQQPIILSPTSDAPPSYPATPSPLTQPQPQTVILQQPQPQLQQQPQPQLQQQPQPQPQQQPQQLPQQQCIVTPIAQPQPVMAQQQPFNPSFQHPYQGQILMSPTGEKTQVYQQVTTQPTPQFQYQTSTAPATIVQYPMIQHQVVTPTMGLVNLQQAAARVTCPKCNALAFTRIQMVSGNTTHGWAALFFFLFLAPCIPYLMGSLKDVEHYCGNCGQLLAVWHKSGRTVVMTQG